MNTPPPRFSPVPRPAVEDLEARALAAFEGSDDDIFGAPDDASKVAGAKGAKKQKKLGRAIDYASAERQAAIISGGAAAARLDAEEERGIYQTAEASMLAAMERPAAFSLGAGASVAAIGAFVDAAGLALMISAKSGGGFDYGLGAWLAFLVTAILKVSLTAGLAAAALWLLEKKTLAWSDLLMLAGLLSWAPWIAFWMQWPAWALGFSWIFVAIWFVSSSFALCKTLPLALGGDLPIGVFTAAHLAFAWVAQGSLPGLVAATAAA